jgi:hypothetical protein
LIRFSSTCFSDLYKTGVQGRRNPGWKITQSAALPQCRKQTCVDWRPTMALCLQETCMDWTVFHGVVCHSLVWRTRLVLHLSRKKILEIY